MLTFSLRRTANYETSRYEAFTATKPDKIFRAISWVKWTKETDVSGTIFFLIIRNLTSSEPRFGNNFCLHHQDTTQKITI